MGRLRIKKKEVVIPFKQTLAYRMGLLMISLFVLLYAIYAGFSAFRADETTRFVVSLGLLGLAGVSLFYNLDQMRFARVPDRTRRMRRR